MVTLAKKYGITTPYTSYLVVPDAADAGGAAAGAARVDPKRDVQPRPLPVPVSGGLAAAAAPGRCTASGSAPTGPGGRPTKRRGLRQVTRLAQGATASSAGNRGAMTENAGQGSARQAQGREGPGASGPS